ncbi:MAG: alpha/beta hydrolase, partial [Sinomicrobium sp.]|nr:alpha/beta hydrolase [Sinomicrobium sp.]
AAFTDRNYEKYSPDGPAHFEVVWKKIKELWLKHPAYTQQDLMSIKTPALIMAGDQDVISLEHTAQFQQALVYAQLCIVPGTTHGLLKEKPEIVNKILLDFLLNPFPFPEEEKQ